MVPAIGGCKWVACFIEETREGCSHGYSWNDACTRDAHRGLASFSHTHPITPNCIDSSSSLTTDNILTLTSFRWRRQRSPAPFHHYSDVSVDPPRKLCLTRTTVDVATHSGSVMAQSHFTMTTKCIYYAWGNPPVGVGTVYLCGFDGPCCIDVFMPDLCKQGVGKSVNQNTRVHHWERGNQNCFDGNPRVSFM